MHCTLVIIAPNFWQYNPGSLLGFQNELYHTSSNCFPDQVYGHRLVPLSWFGSQSPIRCWQMLSREFPSSESQSWRKPIRRQSTAYHCSYELTGSRQSGQIPQEMVLTSSWNGVCARLDNSYHQSVLRKEEVSNWSCVLHPTFDFARFDLPLFERRTLDDNSRSKRLPHRSSRWRHLWDDEVKKSSMRDVPR